MDDRNSQTNLEAILSQKITPAKLTKMENHKRDLRYLDQWDLTTLMTENVDIPNCQAALSIPMVDHPISKSLQVSISLVYNSGEHAINGLLGNGWIAHLPNDYIIVDQNEGVFPDNFEYYLMVNSQMEKLTRNSTNGGRDDQQFQLEDDESIQITYQPQNERWIIDTQNLRSVYGRDENSSREALQRTLFWETWRGPGRGDRDKLKSQVQAWYVISREEKHSQRNKILYEYHIEQDQLPNGMSYTSTVNLKTIRDDHNSTRLDLVYGTKVRGEYVIQSPVTPENFLRFPVFLQSKKYLEGYRLSTGHFKQEIQFQYQTHNDKVRNLVSISQLYPELELSEKLFLFEYDTEHPLLVKLQKGIDASSSIIYEYSDLQVPLLNFGADKNTARFYTTEHTQVSIGSDYAVMAYRRNDERVYVTVLNEQLTSAVAQVEISDGSSNVVENFVLLTYPNLVAVFVETATNRYLSTFHRNLESQEWSQIQVKCTFEKGALFRYSEHLMVVSRNTTGQISVFEPDEKNEENGLRGSTISLSPDRPLKRLVVQGRVILAYDSSSLFTVTKDMNNVWKKNSNLLTVSSDEEAFINDLHIDEEFAQYFKDQVKLPGLQMIQNMVLLSVVKWQQEHFSCKAYLLLINDKYEVARSDEYFPGTDKTDKPIEDITDEIDQDGYIHKFHYEKVSENRWQTKAYELTGKYDDDLRERCDEVGGCTPDEWNKAKKQQLEQFNLESHAELRKMVLFDPRPCLEFQLDYKGSKTNSTLIHMQGDSWLQENKEKDDEDKDPISNMALAKEFILESRQGKNDTSFQLYKQNLENGGKMGEVLEEFTISANGSMAVGYPSYLAYQEEPYLEPVIIPLKQGGATGEKIILMKGEKLLPSSNEETVLTLLPLNDDSLRPYTHELLSRRVTTLVASAPTVVVQKSEVRDVESGTLRVRTYENSYFSNRDMLTQENTVRVIPTGNASYSGWYEETTFLPVDEPFKAKKDTKWMNAEGKVVRSKVNEFKDEEEEVDEANKLDYKILDISGGLQIGDIFPYNRTHQMISYFGFELYENPRLEGTSVNWTYPFDNIVREGNAFTGESFLGIGEGQKLSSVLTPTDQISTYVASCWIRSSPMEEYKFEVPVPYFKANLQTSIGTHKFLGLYGQMKREKDNWLYLEVTADFNKIRDNVYAEYYEVNKKQSNFTLPPPDTAKFTISIEIDSSKHPDRAVDIDHIRFMPIHSDSRIKVYNESNGNEVATILPNGAVTRKVYNTYGQEVANVNESGEIEQLKSTSHTGTIFPTPIFGSGIVQTLTGMKSNLIIRPEWSSYENVEFASGKWVTDDKSGWETFNWQIRHIHSNLTNELMVSEVSKLFDLSSSSIRCDFSIDSGTDSKIQFVLEGGLQVQIRKDSTKPLTSIISVASAVLASNLPLSGEIILFLENSTIWLWLNGNLVVEQKLETSASTPWSKFSIKVGGLVTISNLMIFNRPQIFQEFFNGFGDRTQVIQLESEDSVLINEVIYDEIGREAIKTKTGRIERNTLGRSIELPLFTYLPNFATNKNPHDPNSVFKSGILEGLVSDLYPEDEGFPYQRKVFLKDLLRESEIDGLPGREFSTASNFTKRHYRESGLPFIRNLFPVSQGFMEKVVREPNGSIKVSIIDRREQEIANYVRVPGYEDLLTTFEYDKQGNLLKILPPAYHEKVNTFARTTPLPIGDESLTDNERIWQAKLCTHFKYNDRNYLITKKSPDTGAHEYKYDIQGNMRFMYSVDPESGTAKNIIYLTHATKNQLVEVGHIETEMNIEDLLKFENTTTIPQQVVHQRIVHSDTHSDPEIRGKVRLFMTYTTDAKVGLHSAQNIPPPHQELLKYDSENHIVLKTSNAIHSDLLTNLHKHYKRGRISELQYPRNSVKGFRDTTLNLIHSRDKAGNLVGLGTRTNPNQFSRFTYSSGGTIMEEIIEPGTTSQFTRTYKYDSPGHLVEISDKFLTQSLAFTQDGYGQNGFGDGIIMKTGFNATWGPESLVDPENFSNWFGINEDGFADDKVKTMCISALKRLGFVDASTAVPLKFLTYKDTFLLPMPCAGSMGHELMKMIAEKLPPSRFYGYRYAYGTHQELTKSKFYSGNSVEDSQGIDPLQVYTFSNDIADGIDQDTSEQIWDALTQGGYIITDNKRPDDKTAAIGKEGTEPIFAYNRLDADLNAIDPYYFAYTRPILEMLFEIIHKNENMVDLETFQEAHVVRLGHRDASTPDLIINRAKAAAKTMYEMLNEKGYLSRDIRSILEERFVESLNSFPGHLTQIVGVLRSHFSTQIGTTVNDYEAFSIDSNGNQKMFYVGLERHTIDYTGDTNHVSQLRIQDPFGIPGENVKVFELDHDSLGNVNKAPHRNIVDVRYHPVTNRPVYIGLMDGRKLIFQYDAQGERILKRVYDSKDVVLSEVKYLRDEKGHVLMDERTKYAQTEEEITTTISSTYLHGPRGLLGFIRNGKFYNVFTDHAGSIRLVTQSGRVVAGYEYWPYGELMRVFGDDDGHINYRFTGQEWDEETGLYNYHARIYDPILGRFFQPDPKSQYYSPYVYAGNSPISLVDPDGEFFLLLLFGLIGAFLGGASANGSFNPFKWDWKSIDTYIGMAWGAFKGVMIPGAFATLAASFGGGLVGIAGALLAGLGGSYVSMAIVNKNWNPGNWNWANPSTWNAFFSGFRRGLKVGIKATKDLGKTLSRTGQIAKFMRRYAVGTLINFVKGTLVQFAKDHRKDFNFKEWDLTNPMNIAAIRSGLFSGSGSGLPQMSASHLKALTGFIENGNLKDMLKSLSRSTSELFKTILKDKNHPLYKSVGAGLLNHMSVAIEQGSSFDITKWDWKSLSTYEGILNGLAEASEIINMVGEYRDGNLKIEKRKIFEQLTTKKGQVSGFLTQVIKGMDQLSQFYLPRIPVKKESVVPIAVHLLLNIVGPNTSDNKQEDESDYEAELRLLLEGISAGSKIYPDSDLGQYLDCNVGQNVSGKNFEFEVGNCDIGTGAGKTSRQNREYIHKLFESTEKYQSPSSFTEVLADGNQGEPDEFLDWFVLSLKNIQGYQTFFQDYFVGATYSSLLNYMKNQTEIGNVFMRYETIQGVSTNVLHVAYLSDSLLSVRVILFGNPENFTGVTNYIKEQKYRCQFPQSIAQQINKIDAQVYLIQNSQGSNKLFTLTPTLSLDMSACNGAPQFLQIRPPTNGLLSVVPDFESFLQETGTTTVKVEKFEKFARVAMSVYDDSVEKLEKGPSFLGFLYGMLACNMMNTYELQMQLSDMGTFTLQGRKNVAGQENWHATPVIINSNEEIDIERLLHLFSSTTLSKDAIVTKLEENKLTTFTSKDVPQFNAIFDEVSETGNQLGIENALKYAYYTNVDKVDGAINGNLHYVSNTILGELLAQSIFNENVEISVFSPPAGSQYESRLRAQRLFFLRNKESGSCTVLNVVESSTGSDPIFDPSVPSNIPVIPAVAEGEPEISSIRHLKIKLNINSATDFGDFFQGIEQSEETPSQIPTDSTSYFKLVPEVGDSLRKLSFDKNSIQTLFTLLSENRYKGLVNSEIDFRALASGFLLGIAKLSKADVDGMHVALKSRKSNNEEQSLLTLSTHNFVVPHGEQVLLQKLKFSDEDEELVEAKFIEASNQLKEQFCVNEQQLSEFWKVTTVPAVYAPEVEEAIRFDVDPSSLKDGNCTVEPTSENWYGNLLRRNGNFDPSLNAKSASSKATLTNILPFNVYKFFSRSLHSASEYFFSGNEKPTSSFHSENNHQQGSEWFHDSQENCQAGAWVDGSYAMDGLTCHTDISKMSVFHVINKNDVVTGSNYHGMMIGDSYDKASCSPVEFNGIPSVTCKGQKTNLVYTPYLQDRLFDDLDANIMFGRMLIHWGGRLMRVPSAEEKYYAMYGKEEITISPDLIDIIERKLGKIEKLISDTGNINNKFKNEFLWAQANIEDCRETLGDIAIKQDGIIQRDKVETLRERISALHEDVQEQISYIVLRETTAGMQGGDVDGRKTWNGDNSETDFSSNFNVNINDCVARNYAGFMSSASNIFTNVGYNNGVN